MQDGSPVEPDLQQRLPLNVPETLSPGRAAQRGGSRPFPAAAAGALEPRPAAGGGDGPRGGAAAHDRRRRRRPEHAAAGSLPSEDGGRGGEPGGADRQALHRRAFRDGLGGTAEVAARRPQRNQAPGIPATGFDGKRTRTTRQQCGGRDRLRGQGDTGSSGSSSRAMVLVMQSA